MNFNKKYMLFTLVVILLAFIVNYSVQQVYQQTNRQEKKNRRSIYFGKNEIIKNIYLAKRKDPKFLAYVDKKLATAMQGKTTAEMVKLLEQREWLIYAEALGFYNSAQAISLMKKIYFAGGIKTRNRILKGLGAEVGKYNLQLLRELKKRLAMMNDQERVMLFLASYVQIVNGDTKHNLDQQREIIRHLKQFLSFAHPMVNFTILHFFVEHNILDADVVKFSKQVVIKILGGNTLSPVLFANAVRVLYKRDMAYIRKYHHDLLTKPKAIFIRYYISTLRFSCYIDLQFARKMLGRTGLDYEIFRPFVSELRFIGGDKIVDLFKFLQQQNLGKLKQRLLSRVMKKVKTGPSAICPTLF